MVICSAVLNFESGRKLLAARINYCTLAYERELFIGSTFRVVHELSGHGECVLNASSIFSNSSRLAGRGRP